MTKKRIPITNLTDLVCEAPEIYIAGVTVNQESSRDDLFYECKGKVYEVISRKKGKLESYLLGELEAVKIYGTDFTDPEKKALWEQFHSGELSFDELKARGGEEGFDPIPKGDYLARLSGVSGSKGIMGLQTHRYDLNTNETFGDTYKMLMFFKEVPTEKVKTMIRI
ncbi:hypothetical protein HOI26_03880 [Candidatus Woesearchaeota archaeon]|jgi:hypothetical protein|nr:hypothetical protein [Candidatus Woesearchaeota archaeon]MBT5740215.1 hypothetical protein [Candidatus Woesearchaeota archaeon]